jgi:hypothetical protein
MKSKPKKKNNESTQFVFPKLFPWQLSVHRGLQKYGKGSGHIHICKSKRQVGKSLLLIGELLYFSINHRTTVNGCISPTLNQSRKLYKEILKITQDTGVIKKKNDSLLEIEFINGSTILFKSAEQRDNLRGYTYTGILCIDEAAYIADEIYSIVKPSTDVHKTPVLIVSTPKFRLGFFFELFNKGITGDYPNISSYDFNNFDTSCLLSPESLEMYKQMLPKNQFLTEYLGEFMDSDSSVFTGFKDCIKQPKNDKYKELYVGIDWGNGTGQDDTVITGINESGEQVFLEYFNNRNTTQQIEYIVEYLKQYPQIKMIYAEYNSLGKPLTDLLRDKIKIKIENWLTTNESKARIVSQLQVAFEQKKISLLNDDKQTAELAMYEATYNMKTGNVSYNAPAGGHDDICIALMLALECKNKCKKTGQYSFLFV